jgi:Rrf2 family nitric oxide-sensitive transcriptional repressor
MKLTQYSDLGLRLLMYLAMRYDETVTIQEVSIRFAISKNHLVKISHHLTGSGLIESTRGRNGGVRLACDPASISIEEALLSTEDNFDLVECFGEQNQCVITDVCKLSGVLDRAREAFFSVLRQTTLADLVKSKKTLEAALMPFPQTSTVKFYPRTIYPASQKARK